MLFKNHLTQLRFLSLPVTELLKITEQRGKWTRSVVKLFMVIQSASATIRTNFSSVLLTTSGVHPSLIFHIVSSTLFHTWREDHSKAFHPSLHYLEVELFHDLNSSLFHISSTNSGWSSLEWSIQTCSQIAYKYRSIDIYLFVHRWIGRS